MSNGKTVWLLGSGFSKPLGGPLLADLFNRREHESRLEPFIPSHTYPKLARHLAWSKGVFLKGKDEDLWVNAEQFLSYVDEGYTRNIVPKRDRLKSLIQGLHWQTAGLSDVPNTDAGQRAREETDEIVSNFDRIVRRGLAAECCRFLMLENRDEVEHWKPYTIWVDCLHPDRDTVLCFNYDRVTEMADDRTGKARKMSVLKPGERRPLTSVPVLKLHGSVDWRLTPEPSDPSEVKLDRNTVPEDKLFRDPAERIAIAAPGGSKARFVTSHLEDLWQQAETALKEAGRVMIVGYSFPDTDPIAQLRLLEAFRRGGTPCRHVYIVLGDDTTYSARRVHALVKSAAGISGVKVGEMQDQPGLYANLLPMSTQDFIGRHASIARY